MNKFINIFSFLLAVIFLFSSCDDFLDTKPYSGVDQNLAITDLQGAKAAITGVYDGLQASTSYGRDYVVFGDVLTDNLQIAPTNSGRFLAEAAWGWTSSTSDFESYWNRAYNIINRANNILNSNISGDEASVNQIKGEAYAVRALIYFDMVRLFAQQYNFTADHSHLGVPYVTKHDPLGVPSRNTVGEVYEKIISDLQQAAQFVKGNRTETPSPYSIGPNAINALFSRVYLFMGNYKEAKTYAELVIPKYSLISNSDYISSWTSESTSESIFTITYSTTDNNATGALGYIYYESQGGGVGGYGDLLVNPALISLYNTNDVRRGWFVKGVAASHTNFYYAIGKYPGRGSAGLDNYSVIRLSEIYLIAAEASARLGDEPTAIKYLDAIRKRALTSASTTTLTGGALIDAILLEKRKELAFEGHYFHDLKRLNLVVNGALTGTGGLGAVIGVDDTRRAFPIPQREMDANSNMVQNPGYVD